ncbi:hypothetical protein [Kineosporia sp. R_H_3]|uniref:hypothetical protein n=1 Tax=Kineosporia sp. R_H_3 TaxID=1961848 RepID=UPI000B4ACCA6|nr:hypothetical protein [Kineosporia sp. R_H_3]
MTASTPAPGGPTANPCAALREDAAVALLGGEPLPDAVREHQELCPTCRDEFARLAVLPALLDVTRDESVPHAEVPDEALLLRTLEEMRHRRQRRRRLLVAVAAAAALLVAVPAGVLVAREITETYEGPGTAVARPGDVLVAEGTAQDPASPVGADVHVLAHGEGRGSILVVAPWGLTSGVTCRIELVDSGGWTHPVQTWVVPAGYKRGWKTRVAVNVPPLDVLYIRLVDDATDVLLLTVPLSRT